MSSTMRRSSASILVLMLYPLSLCTLAQTKSIVLSGSRPVAKAIEQVEAIYGWPITYEDPAYVHEGELTDVTDEVSRDPQSVSRVLIPKRRTLHFSYSIPSLNPSSTGRNDGVVRAIEDILDSYAAFRGADMFAVVEDNGLLNVVPTHFVNADGRIEQITPLLDTVVSVLPKERTGADLLNDLCGSLSQITGQPVVVGTGPSAWFMQHVTTISGSGVTARSLLSQLLGEMDIHLSWQLFYDPGLRWYVLNIHSVRWG